MFGIGWDDGVVVVGVGVVLEGWFEDWIAMIEIGGAIVSMWNVHLIEEGCAIGDHCHLDGCLDQHHQDF